MLRDLEEENFYSLFVHIKLSREGDKKRREQQRNAEDGGGCTRECFENDCVVEAQGDSRQLNLLPVDAPRKKLLKLTDNHNRLETHPILKRELGGAVVTVTSSFGNAVKTVKLTRSSEPPTLMTIMYFSSSPNLPTDYRVKEKLLIA